MAAPLASGIVLGTRVPYHTTSRARLPEVTADALRSAAVRLPSDTLQPTGTWIARGHLRFSQEARAELPVIMGGICRTVPYEVSIDSRSVVLRAAESGSLRRALASTMHLNSMGFAVSDSDSQLVRQDSGRPSGGSDRALATGQDRLSGVPQGAFTGCRSMTGRGLATASFPGFPQGNFTGPGPSTNIIPSFPQGQLSGRCSSASLMPRSLSRRASTRTVPGVPATRRAASRGGASSRLFPRFRRVAGLATGSPRHHLRRDRRGRPGRGGRLFPLVPGQHPDHPR